MAAARPPPSCILLERAVREAQTAFPVKPKGEWSIVEIATKEAFGCGKYSRSVAEGLTLFARLADKHPDRYALSLHASGRVYRSIRAKRVDLEADESSVGVMQDDVLVDDYDPRHL